MGSSKDHLLFQVVLPWAEAVRLVICRPSGAWAEMGIDTSMHELIRKWVHEDIGSAERYSTTPILRLAHFLNYNIHYVK